MFINCVELVKSTSIVALCLSEKKSWFSNKKQDKITLVIEGKLFFRPAYILHSLKINGRVIYKSMLLATCITLCFNGTRFDFYINNQHNNLLFKHFFKRYHTKLWLKKCHSLLQLKHVIKVCSTNNSRKCLEFQFLYNS